MKKSLTQKLGLLGIVSFLSYTAAVIFAPLSYPGYDWMSQAVSDLSAANAPSLAAWNRLTALYNVCEVLCVAVVCIGIQGKKTKLLRTGVYLFCSNGVGIRRGLQDVSFKRQRLCRNFFRPYAHCRDGGGCTAVGNIAHNYNYRRRKEQGVPFLRCLRCCGAYYDAYRRFGHKSSACGIFRRNGTFQRFCRNGI